MADDHFNRLRQLFERAAELSAPERVALLDSIRSEDGPMADELAGMLKAHEREIDPLDGPPILEVAEGEVELEPGRLEGIWIEGFEVVRLVASGGTGSVYEALQLRPHRRVALKVLHTHLASDAFAQRFGREAEILGKLSHPGIARVYAAGTHDIGKGLSLPFLAMEFIQGKSLTRYAREDLSDTRARVELLIQVCQAVQHAHNCGIIHRDLKPSNVLVDEFGNARVLDFGMARATDVSLNISTLMTTPGTLIGTVAYMSPEQARGDAAAIDERTDVHALGVLLFELLSSALPYELDGRPLHEAVRVLESDDPRSLTGVSPSSGPILATIVAKALEKQPGRRYSSAATLAEDLRRFLADEPILARRQTRVERIWRAARRNRVFLAIAGSVVMALGIALVAALKARAAAEADVERARRLNDHLMVAISATDISGRPAPVSSGVERAFSGPEDGDHLSRLFDGLIHLDRDPESKASLLLGLGQVFEGRFRHTEAEAALSQCLDLEEFLTAEQIVQANDTLAKLYDWQRRPEKALECSRRALDLARSELSLDNATRWAAEFGQLGMDVSLDAHDRLRMHDELFERATLHLPPETAFLWVCRIKRYTRLVDAGVESLEYGETLIRELPPAAMGMTMIVDLNFRLGHEFRSGEHRDLKRALQYHKAAADLALRLLGPDSILYVMSGAMVGEDYRMLGNLELADHYFEEAIRSLPKAIAPESRYYIQVVGKYILQLKATGRADETLEYYELCIPFLKAAPSRRRGPIWVLVDVFDALYAADRLDEAAALLQAAMWRYHEASDSDRDWLSFHANRIAWLLRDSGPEVLGVAEDLVRWSLGVAREDSVSGPAALNRLDTLGVVLTRKGQYPEAEELLREATATSERDRPEEKITTARFRTNLGMCLLAAGKLDEARRELDGALRVLESEPECEDEARAVREALDGLRQEQR